MPNVAPTGLNDVIGIKANTQHKFVAADFGFNDVDGDHLKEVIISTLPAGGSLMLNGVAVTAGLHISAAQIGSLVWTAPTGFIGQQAFTFQVVDDSSASGMNADLSANTLTLNVVAPLATPANINLGALDGANGFKLSGVATFDRSGSSVSSAGDLNGDGYDDLIVGAPYADPNGNNSGAGYVVFGQAGGFAANIDLASLDGSNGFRIGGVAGAHHAGISVSSAGDVNGDGLADLIIGADSASTTAFKSGASYVLFGTMSGFAANIDLSALDGSNGFAINGAAAYDRSGTAVSSAGDINGDGFDDLIIGAKFADPNGNTSGATYVIFGKASGFADIDLATLSGTNGFRISGAAAYDNSGTSVSSAGDINGDGFDDLIIGSFGADPNGNFSGASYVVFGKAGGFGDIDLATPLDGSNGFAISGAAAGDYSGRSVSSAGDVNGDGFDDLIIGAQKANTHGPYSGASYVLFGHAAGFVANINLATLDGINGFKISGVSKYDDSGCSVSEAGDFNGDGFGDLIIGAYGAGPNGRTSGASYVLFGKPTGFAANIDLSSLDGSNGFRIGGESAYDFSGRSASSAGDVNGDGFDDLIIGADGADPNGSSSGASYVLFGHATNIAPTGTPTTVLAAGLEDTSTYSISDAQLLAGFTDADTGDILSVSGLTADHGTFTRSGTGWTYVAEKDYFGAVKLDYTVTDGNSTPIAATNAFTLMAVNDPAIINGSLTGSIGEDATGATGGTATYTDIDNPGGGFLNPAGLNGTFGIFTFNAANGAWTYDVDSTLGAVQALNVNDTLIDSLTIQTPDGTPQDLVVTIFGTNDPALFTAGLIGSIGEDQAGTIGGTVIYADVDNPGSGFMAPASVNGTFGTFTFNAANGAWTYDVNSTLGAVQALNATGKLTDTLTIQSTDGTPKDIVVTINGANDAPTGATTTVFAAGLEDTTTTTITDAQLLAGFSDVDTGDTLAVAGLTADHGSFTLANGIWTYVAEKDYFGKVALSYSVTDGKSMPLNATSSFDLTDVTDVFIGKGKARDVFVGTLGHDEFKGGRGNDTLTSNGLPDTFFFGKNAGRDKILGFDAVGDDHDLINLQGLKSYIKSFSDLSGNHMVQHRKDVVINDGHGDVITLKGVHLADLDAADFLF